MNWEFNFNFPCSLLEEPENIQKLPEEVKQPATNPKPRSKKTTITSTTSKLKNQSSNKWSEEDDKKLFTLYKQKGSLWSLIAKKFDGKTESNVKNRFYSTLRRIARKKTKDMKACDRINEIKHNILDYVDEALEYGHTCFSKRGRPRKIDKQVQEIYQPEILKEEKQEVEAPPQVKEVASLMDTAESPKVEEQTDLAFKLDLSLKEIINVNQSMFNLHRLEESINDASD